MGILEVNGVSISVDGRRVVSSVYLSVGFGDILYILGPNGSGKTSLLRGIIGFPGYNVVSGSIVFDGEDVTSKPIEYRVSRGLAIAHQFTPKLSNIDTLSLLEYVCRRFKCDNLSESIDLLNIRYLLNRSFGKGFSGGELKRVELATILLQRPKLALIDEPDSGVDIDSIMLVAEGIRRLLELSPYKSVVIVTHSGLIAKFIEPTRVCIMVEGTIRYCGSGSLLGEVLKYGFKVLDRVG
ncbi:MAG: ATP-binding cassette domain-containing protein [Acidilobaceae archaeon]